MIRPLEQDGSHTICHYSSLRNSFPFYSRRSMSQIMKHHGCRSHIRDQSKLTGQEERFDLVVDSNDVILERVVGPASLPLLQSRSLKRIHFTSGPRVCLPGDPPRRGWWCEQEPAARHACRLSASKDCRFQLESQGWLINLAAPPPRPAPIFFCVSFKRKFCASCAVQALKSLGCCVFLMT